MGDRLVLGISEELYDRLFDDDSVARAQALNAGRPLTVGPSASRSVEAIGTQTQFLVTGWDTPALTEQLLDRAPELQLIAHTGGSIRRIVPPSVYGRGIRVTTVSEVLADAVAEFTVLSILAGLRRFPAFASAMRAGEPWSELEREPPGTLLQGRTVGLVGASRVGRATARLLAPFGCTVLVSDPYLTKGEADTLGVVGVELDELLTKSQVLSMHAPVLPSTIGMIGARELALLPAGALVVNTARAALFNGPALMNALQQRRIHAVLDVFDEEPLPADSPWRDLPGTLVTPHIAALTSQTLTAQGAAALAEIDRLVAGSPLVGEISAEGYDRIA